jgi:hypothetical protein
MIFPQAPIDKENPFECAEEIFDHLQKRRSELTQLRNR